jgi:hypothetical protein
MGSEVPSGQGEPNAIELHPEIPLTERLKPVALSRLSLIAVARISEHARKRVLTIV